MSRNFPLPSVSVWIYHDEDQVRIALRNAGVNFVAHGIGVVAAEDAGRHGTRVTAPCRADLERLLQIVNTANLPIVDEKVFGSFLQ